MDRLDQINTFNRLIKVSRETIESLIIYENILIRANKSLNLVGNSTIKQVWTRHFLDSAQVIDFIDKNDKSLLDLGSGAGFPGLILAILAKDRKIPLKIRLLEKSPKKINFLKKIIGELDLKVETINHDILIKPTKLNEQVLVARAFKPLDAILKLIHKNTNNWKKFFVFLGKSGKTELLQASKSWDIEYKQRVSITNSDSMILEINKLKKK